MISLKTLKINKKNPRKIEKESLQKLIDSIREFPKMMELRPIIIDEDNTILGGNMRYRALLELGYSEIPDNWVKKASELSEEEKKRFVITDNVQFGFWDYELLYGDDWNIQDLQDWGLDIEEKKNPDDFSEVKEENIEDIELPLYNEKAELLYKKLVVVYKDENKKKLEEKLGVIIGKAIYEFDGEKFI